MDNMLNTKSWNSFYLKNLFQIEKPSARSKNDYEEGSVPFVASGNYNNGIECFLTPKNENDIEEGNCLTISPLDGSTFYQEKDFLGRGGAGSSIFILRNEKLNKYNGLFIASVIRFVFSQYTYNNMINQDILNEEPIQLPVDKNNEPDWEFMENYIKSVIPEIQNKIENLSNISMVEKALPLQNWKEFKIGDIFPNFVKPSVLHKREVEENEFGIPYVVRTKFNNGIKYRVNKKDNMNTSPAGVISFGSENATFFYQEEEFVSGRDIYYIDTRQYSKEVCFFILTCLQTITHRYSYNYGMFPELVKEEYIKLPINDKEEPDWDYMEDFIKKLTKGKKKDFDNLMKII